jgi:hypothetical protein
MLTPDGPVRQHGAELPFGWEFGIRQDFSWLV